DSAVDIYQQIIALINHENFTTPHIYLLPAHLNIAGNLARKGMWSELKKQIDQFHKLIENIGISSAERRTYARAIYYMRILETQVALAFGNDDTIESKIRLIEELALQLQEKDVERYLSPFEQLQALFSTRDEDAFLEWYSDFKNNRSINLFDHSTYACILQKRGYEALATTFAKDILRETSTETQQATYKQDLSVAGIQGI
ncbi:MAG: hypothetical protein AAFV98_13735, partial [Chloroflexota bacterium]